MTRSGEALPAPPGGHLAGEPLYGGPVTVPEMPETTDPTWLDLLDWRRRVAEMYAEVRGRRAHDPAGAHRWWAEERSELFRTHPQSPLPAEARGAFTGLPVWPYDPALVFGARVRSLPEEHLLVASSTGQDLPLVRFGRAEFGAHSLDLYWINVYGGGVFVPFKDATSGRESYGGGRYLLDTVKGADLGSTPAGDLVLDFNFAYHPSCFYDARWSCPLAPPQNVLNFPVRAGERTA